MFSTFMEPSSFHEASVPNTRSQPSTSTSQHYSMTTTIRHDGNGSPVVIREIRSNGGAPASGAFGLNGQMTNIADLLAGSGLFMFRDGAEGAQQQHQGVPEEVIEQLPVETISEKHCKCDSNGKLEMPTCSVCISDFEMGKEATVLPCGHTFHSGCIKPWLKSNDKCPVCRKQVTEPQQQQ